MKFFNLDCHVSVIADITNIFETLGHTVQSWSLSDHSWIFGKARNHVAHVNQDTWRNLNQGIIESFNKEYNKFLKEFDGFICTYPPAFSMLYDKYEKPIYVQIPIRYEYPFTAQPEKWNGFNSYLINGHKTGQIKLISNSAYDAEYTHAFTGIKPTVIRNICQYTNYNRSKPSNKILCHSRLGIPPNIEVTYTKSLGNYSWSKIDEFKAVIFIPYNCSQMSFFEYYSSGMPIICPTLRFLNELRRNHPDQVMSELSWNKIIGHPPQSSILCNREHDPNAYTNHESMDYWSQYSDYYTMQGVFYFDNWEELVTTINNVHHIDRSEYKKEIISQWESLLKT